MIVHSGRQVGFFSKTKGKNFMEDINLKQLTLAVRTIAEEKNLPEDVVMSVIEQSIAAAWRRDNGEREQNVRAELNTNDGTANVYVIREVVEDPINDAIEVGVEEAQQYKRCCRR